MDRFLEYYFFRICPDYCYKNDPWYQKNPDLLIKQHELCHQDNLKQQFPQFFQSLTDADINQMWAQKVIGMECRQSPQNIANLLGWNWNDQAIGYIKYYSTFVVDSERIKKWTDKIYHKIKQDSRYDGFELDVILEKYKNK